MGVNFLLHLMATNLLFVPTVYFFYPETSNIRLEDIDYIFSRGMDPVNEKWDQKKMNAVSSRVAHYVTVTLFGKKVPGLVLRRVVATGL
jgi:hypothetical protein